jgi:antitoxin ParD1/3/4
MLSPEAAKNLPLMPTREELIAQKMQSGRYQSASEVVREGLPLPEDRDRLRVAGLQEVRRKIQVGLDQLERGERISGDEALKELVRKSAAARRKQRDG